MSDAPDREITRTDAEWRDLLSSFEYQVLRQAGTERAFSGEYWNTKTAGTYVCRGCDTPLYSSKTKYSSGCGWPSFFDDLGEDRIEIRVDRAHGMLRQEILCRACGGHLGHVFNDGPPPTGIRHCVNSASVKLVPDP